MLESNIKCCLFLYLKLCFVAFKITYESNILYLYSAHILMRLLGWDVLGERIKLIVGKITYIFFFFKGKRQHILWSVHAILINRQKREATKRNASDEREDCFDAPNKIRNKRRRDGMANGARCPNQRRIRHISLGCVWELCKPWHHYSSSWINSQVFLSLYFCIYSHTCFKRCQILS
jgi:hypothetical protein